MDLLCGRQLESTAQAVPYPVSEEAFPLKAAYHHGWRNALPCSKAPNVGKRSNPKQVGLVRRRDEVPRCECVRLILERAVASASVNER